MLRDGTTKIVEPLKSVLPDAQMVEKSSVENAM